MSRSLYSAWLAHDPAALQLIAADARDPSTRKRAVERAATTTVAPALLEELRRQQALLPRDEARDRNLERLAQPGTVAVITGQQVGLFLGPLYTFYKAATAVVAARELEKETGVPCVPVFWLQTEDHDFAEIDHCEIPGAWSDVAGAEQPAASAERVGHSAGRVPDSAERLVGSTARVAGSAERAADSAERVAGSAERAADSAERVAGSTERVAGSAERVAGSAVHAVHETPPPRSSDAIGVQDPASTERLGESGLASVTTAPGRAPAVVETVRLALSDAMPGAERIPVGHRSLGPSVARCADDLERHLAGQPHASEVLAIVRRHYTPGRSLASAFAGMLAELLAGDGLIIFDPRQPAVAALWAPMLEHAILDEQRITFVLEERSAAIRAAGFEPQVHVRHGSPLVFVHPDGATGPRYRVDRQEDGRFLLVGTERSLSRDELFTRARRDPFTLSSSALLRPILQDALFPTAMYIGGPGELGYAAQLAPLYRHFGMAPTLFLPRAGFRLIDVKTRRALDGLGISASQASATPEALLEQHQLDELKGHPQAEAFERALLEPALAAIEQASKTALQLDPELERAAVRTRETIRRAVSRFAGRYRRTRLERSTVTLTRIQRVRAMLFPGGDPQERRFAWPAFAAAFGVRPLHDAVLGAIQPFEPGTRDLLP